MSWDSPPFAFLFQRSRKFSPTHLDIGKFRFFFSKFSKNFLSAYNGNGTATYRYLCNHRRAYKFFTDSISPKCYFTAFPCESYDKFEKKECFDCGKNGQECGRLGYYSNLAKGRGSLYLMTREEDPFCGKKFFSFFFVKESTLSNSTCSIGGKIQIFKKHVFNFYRNPIHG